MPTITRCPCHFNNAVAFAVSEMCLVTKEEKGFSVVFSRTLAVVFYGNKKLSGIALCKTFSTIFTRIFIVVHYPSECVRLG